MAEQGGNYVGDHGVDALRDGRFVEGRHRMFQVYRSVIIRPAQGNNMLLGGRTESLGVDHDGANAAIF